MILDTDPLSPVNAVAALRPIWIYDKGLNTNNLEGQIQKSGHKQTHTQNQRQKSHH